MKNIWNKHIVGNKLLWVAQGWEKFHNYKRKLILLPIDKWNWNYKFLDWPVNVDHYSIYGNLDGVSCIDQTALTVQIVSSWNCYDG